MTREEQLKFIEEKIPLETHFHSSRKMRHTFFKDIQTEVQAYMLGFYAADGGLNEKRKTLRIQLSEDDYEIVNLFKDLICPTARTFRKQKRNLTIGRHGETYNCAACYGVDINSTIICQSLVDLGFGYRKTWEEHKFPNIDKKLIRHFIRGYFDGDGSIIGSYVKPDLKYKKNERFRAYWNIVSKTESILKEIQIFLKEKGINSTICFARRDQMYQLSSPTSQLSKIYDLLYKDSYFYMKRKRDKIHHYVNTEVTQLIAEHRNAQKVSVNESNNPSTSAGHPIDQGENVC